MPFTLKCPLKNPFGQRFRTWLKTPTDTLMLVSLSWSRTWLFWWLSRPWGTDPVHRGLYTSSWPFTPEVIEHTGSPYGIWAPSWSPKAPLKHWSYSSMTCWLHPSRPFNELPDQYQGPGSHTHTHTHTVRYFVWKHTHVACARVVISAWMSHAPNRGSFSREGQSGEGRHDDLSCRQNDRDPMTSLPMLRSWTRCLLMDGTVLYVQRAGEQGLSLWRGWTKGEGDVQY